MWVRRSMSAWRAALPSVSAGVNPRSPSDGAPGGFGELCAGDCAEGGALDNGGAARPGAEPAGATGRGASGKSANCVSPCADCCAWSAMLLRDNKLKAAARMLMLAVTVQRGRIDMWAP